MIILGLKKEQIHSVEMVGEATRIPVVQQRCKEVFGVEHVSRTLNSLECVGRGASLQAAMLSPLFKVADYQVQEYNAIPISITYSFPPAQGEEAKQITKELFNVGSNFPATKTITFDNKKGNMNLLIHYSESAQLLPGLPREVASYIIKEGKQKHNEKVAFILRVSNNIHQIPILESSDLQEEWTEEEKIPIKKDVPAPPKPAEAPKPADGAAQPEGAGAQPAADAEMKTEEQKQPEAPKQEYEIRKKAKKTTVAIAYDSQSHALPQNARADFHKKEAAWFNEDHNILELKATKNDLESFTYDLKNNLDSYGPYEAYLEPAKRAETMKKLQETVDWIYGEGQSAPAQQYKERYD
jgi:heat shock protein 4